MFKELSSLSPDNQLMFMAKKKSVNKKRKITRKVKKTCRCASGKDKNSKVKKLIKLAKSGKKKSKKKRR